MAGFERILIICPPHLVPKWKREVEQTVPGVRAAIVESITDLERLRLSIGSGPLFAVMSREKAKLTETGVATDGESRAPESSSVPTSALHPREFKDPTLAELLDAEERLGRPDARQVQD